MRALASSALVSALLLAVATPAAADGMRCGSKLVTKGDPRAKVRQFCGEPTDIQTRHDPAPSVLQFRRSGLIYGDG